MKRLVIELDYTKFTLWALNITTGSMKEMAKYLVYPLFAQLSISKIYKMFCE